MRRRRSSHSPKQCYITFLQRCARLPPAFYANLPTGNWSFTLSPTMVNCWTISTEGTSAAQGSDSSGGVDPSPSFASPVERPWSLASAELPSVPIPKNGKPRSRRTGMLKIFQRPRKNSIGLHSQNVAWFPKHPEHCAEWFGHFRQRKSRGAIDLFLL